MAKFVKQRQQDREEHRCTSEAPSFLAASPPIHPRSCVQDVGGYSKTLAEQGFLLTHWEIVRDLWMDAMRSSPYMEAYELQNMERGMASAAYRFFELHVLKPMAEAIAEMESLYQDESNSQLVRRLRACSEIVGLWLASVIFLL